MTTPAYLRLDYIDNCIVQTLLWMNGKPEHRNDECCIDFSCCYPELMYDTNRRIIVGRAKLLDLYQRRQSALNGKGNPTKLPTGINEDAKND